MYTGLESCDVTNIIHVHYEPHMCVVRGDNNKLVVHFEDVTLYSLIGSKHPLLLLHLSGVLTFLHD